MKLLYPRFFIAFTIILFAVTGCKKDKLATNTIPNVSLIRQSVLPSGDENSLFTFTYDGNQNLVSVKHLNPTFSSNQNEIITYEYANGRIIAATTKTADKTSTKKHVYDAAGRLTTIQVIPLQYHQIADGTFVPYNQIKDQYNFSYDSGGRITRIELVNVLGIYNDQEKRYYYDYEYNSNNELTKLTWQEKGDYPGGNTWVFEGWTEEVGFNPEVIRSFDYGDLNPMVLSLIKKMPKSMKMYFNTDLNGKVYDEHQFEYKITNKKLESLTTTKVYHSWDTDTILFTLIYKYDFSY
ncbi:hypothetical protein IDJ75_12235 [Mucilaginibacter rigui]|uniref:DUF4595 domain-containing protein n=1 Tax=Mucilaginibacter rigui TaxID=534635 RepID=A0ABR7X638_9SPHI|nr:hypothetical protein [Mucilaginibacter rigui]MBD1386053.1 hypothetical protein [Mucilaginibacter rigui]